MPNELDTAHIAGPSFVMRDRLIQRCIICGHRLLDYSGIDLIDGYPHLNGERLHTWVPGAQVLLREGCDCFECQTFVGMFPEDSQAVAHLLCLDLVEE